METLHVATALAAAVNVVESDGETIAATGTIALVKVMGFVVGTELVPDTVTVAVVADEPREFTLILTWEITRYSPAGMLVSAVTAIVS